MGSPLVASSARWTEAGSDHSSGPATDHHWATHWAQPSGTASATSSELGWAARLGHRVFLFGGGEDVLPQLRRRLERRFPGLPIVGTFAHRDPPRGAEADAWVEAIRQAGADLVFVGFGQLRQEQWIVDHRDRLPGVVSIRVGAVFDIHAGRVRQAPGWI